MKKRIALMMAAVMAAGALLAGCGGNDSNSNNTSAAKEADLTYAVEAGSAGEAIAKEKGFKYNSVASQADALMEVSAGTSDAAIIDLLMAGAMIGEGTSYPDMVHTDELTTEEYGVGCRKGSDLASDINAVLADSYADAA